MLRRLRFFDVPGLSVLLALALAVQVGVRRSWPLAPEPASSILGKPLYNASVISLDEDAPVRLSEVLRRDGACSLLVVINTGCHVCASMRHTWGSRARAWSDSIGEQVRLVWLTGESSEALRQFTRSYDLADAAMVTIAARPERTLARLGVFGTPTTYLVDRDGHVRTGVVGDYFPSVAEARQVCSVGAPPGQ